MSKLNRKLTEAKDALILIRIRMQARVETLEDETWLRDKMFNFAGAVSVLCFVVKPIFWGKVLDAVKEPESLSWVDPFLAVIGGLAVAYTAFYAYRSGINEEWKSIEREKVECKAIVRAADAVLSDPEKNKIFSFEQVRMLKAIKNPENSVPSKKEMMKFRRCLKNYSEPLECFGKGNRAAHAPTSEDLPTAWTKDSEDFCELCGEKASKTE